MAMQLSGAKHLLGYMDVPRNVVAGAVGIAQGLVENPWVPVGTLAVGLAAQVAERRVSGLMQLQYATEGLVDGSLALIGRNLTMHIMASTPPAAANARGYSVDSYARGLTDADAIVG